MRVGGATWELPEPQADGKPSPDALLAQALGAGFISNSQSKTKHRK